MKYEISTQYLRILWISVKKKIKKKSGRRVRLFFIGFEPLPILIDHTLVLFTSIPFKQFSLKFELKLDQTK
jgi:hypothetical protein